MPKKIIYISLVIVTFLLTLLPISAQSGNDLTISAAASLRNVLEEIQIVYQQKKPDINLVYNFASSGSLQQQIEQGAPVDIFFSAASRQMDALEVKDLLLADTRRDLLANAIVLITPVNVTEISSFEDLTKPKIKQIAMGEPRSVPAGQYAEEVLNFYGIWEQIEDKLIFGNTVSQVLTFVDSGNVDAGLVYSTDAKTSERVTVVATAPPESHSPIIYPIAIIKDSQQVDIAQEFIDFLATSEAQTIFTKYGFQPLN